MMDSADDPYPDEESEMLNVLALSGLQKRTFGRDVASGRVSSFELHYRTSLKRRTIQKYAHVVRIGGILYARGGRPCILDTEGLEAIAKYWCQQQELTRDAIKELIDMERENTVRRRLGKESDFDVTLGPLHRSTYHKYISILRLMMMSLLTDLP